jgi:hypothetical protein
MSKTVKQVGAGAVRRSLIPKGISSFIGNPLLNYEAPTHD